MTGMLRSEARRHGVSIRTDLKDDLPMTVGDRVQIQQVLMNLMLNGIEAITDAAGVVTVKSQLDGDGQIEISVNDTGRGHRSPVVSEFVEFLGQNVIKKIDWKVVDTDECDSSIEPEPETFVIRI
jgi:phosphoglycerate-specific signal transduction histidine kinase